MANEETKQAALQNGQFAWCRNDKDGKLLLYVGPYRLTPTDDDVFLKPDPNNPGKFVPVSHVSEAVQEFITVRDGEYAIIYNPAITFTNERPNGSYTPEKNSLEALAYGKSRVLTSGHFPVWPGQIVEIRKVHELESHEYLIVRVVDAERIDTNAQFYDLTLDCAAIAAAVVDTTDQSSAAADDKEKKGSAESGAASSSAEGESTPPVPESVADKAKPPAGTTGEPPVRKLQTGQRIVIPGSKTPIYIPPTGIEIIPDTSIDDSGRPINQDRARILLEQFEKGKQEISSGTRTRAGSGRAPAELDRTQLSRLIKGAIDGGQISRKTFMGGLMSRSYSDFSGKVDSYKMNMGDSEASALKKSIDGLPADALMSIAEDASLFEEPEIDFDRGTIGGTSVEELKEIAEGPRLVRQAVVLGPTEFCVLLDVEGRPQIHRGPSRVFPGPYDRYQTEGSHRRVYNAYHLRTDRGLLVRIIAERVSKAELAQQLPPGMPTTIGADVILEKPLYLKGDEVFLGGFDAYLVPSNSFEVIHPEKRTPHIGNDHTDIYVKAIGVDQKSGVYVENVKTGQVELIQGEKNLLLDPRKMRHVKRRVPGRAWNLMIGRAEPHKKVDDTAFVETPWALSVIIPNNEAVLVTSKSGRRVGEGPRTELLGYEEWLEKLTLSTGRPKNEDRKVETCFLKVRGNRVTDRIELETMDFVKISVDVAYGVTFIGDSSDEKAQWFDHRNYVRLLYTHLRSLLRNAARKKTLIELQPIIPDFVRDVVLGEKAEGETRRGRHLDNNMLVNEVEVLEISISDDSVAEALQSAQQDAVIRQINDVNAAGQLKSERVQNEISEERYELKLAEVKRNKDLELEKQRANHATTSNKLKQDQEILTAQEKGKQELVDLTLQSQLERERTQADIKREITEASEKQRLELKKSEADLDDEIRKAKDELIIKFKQTIAEIQKGLTGAEADAMEKTLKAIQPDLIAAIEGLGDKQALAKIAENLPEAGGSLGLLTGLGGIAGLKALLAGIGLDKVIDKMDLKRSSREAGTSSSAESH